MIHFLEKANLINPEEAEIYPSMMIFYEMRGNLEKRKEVNEKLFKSNDISSGLINYNYNVLMTLKPNSILITYGDNDTYPIWLLQDLFNVRKDVIVLILPLLKDLNYQSLLFNKINIENMERTDKNDTTELSEKEIANHIITHVNLEKHPLYIALTALNAVNKFENNLYLVGLALEYSKNNFDNLAILRNNFENKYALDYTTNRFEYDISDEIVNRTNAGYLPGIYKLYGYYKSAGDTYSANRIKSLGLQIAKRINQEWYNYVKSILK